MCASVEGRKAILVDSLWQKGWRFRTPDYGLEPQTLSGVRVSHGMEGHSPSNPSSCLLSMGLDLGLGHSQHAMPQLLSWDGRQVEAYCRGRAGRAVFPEQGVN